MKPTAVITTLLVVTFATSSVARADELTVAATVVFSGASAITFTVIDVRKKLPRDKKLYGGIELGVTGAFALLDTYYATTVRIERAPGDVDRAPNLVLGALALWNAGLAVHGGYLFTRSEKKHPTRFAVGGARGTIAPTVVTDGVSLGAGAMIGGSF